MTTWQRRHKESHAKKQFRMGTIPKRRTAKQSRRLRDWRKWGVPRRDGSGVGEEVQAGDALLPISPLGEMSASPPTPNLPCPERTDA